MVQNVLTKVNVDTASGNRGGEGQGAGHELTLVRNDCCLWKYIVSLLDELIVSSVSLFFYPTGWSHHGRTVQKRCLGHEAW